MKDSLVLCDSVWPMMDSFNTPDNVGDPTLEGRLFSAVTGIDTHEEGLLAYGERIFNQQRAILLREGWKAKEHDMPAEYNFVEPVEEDMLNPQLIVPGPTSKQFQSDRCVFGQGDLRVMLLSVEELRFSYGNIKALHGLNFQIDEGEIVCIIGANGAGKSTTLKAISRMVSVEDGSKMTFAGADLLEYAADKVVSQLGISHVPEGRRLFDNLTVMENLKLACFARKDTDQIKEDIKRVFAIFPRLEERQIQKAGTLSGGEQQMLAVGRAYMSGRKVMLLDEPSMGLAPLLMMSMFEALKQINKEGTTILLVEQNARLALHFAQRGYVLESGNLVLEGPSAELLEDPEVKKAYLGG